MAHRGFAAEHPENTLQAFTAALDHADALELDVRTCADDLVVFHDPEVGRVTPQTGPLTEYTAAELSEMPINGTDATIPRLATVLDELPADITINIELKERETVTDVADLIADAPHDIMVSSFDPGTLRAVNDSLPAVPRAYIIEHAHELRTALQLDCTYVHPQLDICRDASFVEKAHHRGLLVNAWTVRDPDTAAVLADTGVDGVITDCHLSSHATS